MGLGTVGGMGVRLLRPQPAYAESVDPSFKISLAEWSLVKTIRAGKMIHLDFPRVAKRQFGIDCVEFVDQFFADKSKDKIYLNVLLGWLTIGFFSLLVVITRDMGIFIKTWGMADAVFQTEKLKDRMKTIRELKGKTLREKLEPSGFISILLDWPMTLYYLFVSIREKKSFTESTLERQERKLGITPPVK